MVQRIVTPEKTNLDISVLLPDNYVGKAVHVLFYTDEEVNSKEVTAVLPKKKPSDFFGTLSADDGKKLHEYIAQSRNEWERDI